MDLISTLPDIYFPKKKNLSNSIKRLFPSADSFTERKNLFLNGLKSPTGKNKYKRYLGAPIRYAGGKSLATGLIIELIPEDVQRVISPFIGGGSVEVAIAKELGLPVIGYDIFDILVKYWQVQLKNPKALYKKLSNLKLSNLDVRCDTFENVIPKFENDFLYCDPPYFLEGDSKMFKGIYPQRNFPVHHNNFDHEKLRDLLLKHKGRFILSYNDCSTIREWYKDFLFINVSWQYTMGQGETRIGLNRKNGNMSHVKKSHEVLIVKL